MLPLVAGLFINVAIDLCLIPTWGLLGAVIGTTVATGVATVALYWINHLAGMQLQRGMVLFSLAPVALCGGVWCGTAALLLLMAMTPFSKTLATAEEREELRQLITTFVRRWNAYWSRAAEQTEPLHAIG